MRLHEQVAMYKRREAELRRQFDHFSGYLLGPKFQGTDPRDGATNDYIRTPEVRAWVRNFRNVIDGYDDDHLLEQEEQEKVEKLARVMVPELDQVDETRRLLQEAAELAPESTEIITWEV